MFIGLFLLQVLGNRSLKIKYLNPSTVFVASGPAPGLLSEDLDSSSIRLTVQIVDTVTGAPIHRQVHKVTHHASQLHATVPAMHPSCLQTGAAICS